MSVGLIDLVLIVLAVFGVYYLWQMYGSRVTLSTSNDTPQVKKENMAPIGWASFDPNYQQNEINYQQNDRDYSGDDMNYPSDESNYQQNNRDYSGDDMNYPSDESNYQQNDRDYSGDDMNYLGDDMNYQYRENNQDQYNRDSCEVGNCPMGTTISHERYCGIVHSQDSDPQSRRNNINRCIDEMKDGYCD
jgi:hypothetical protein